MGRCGSAAIRAIALVLAVLPTGAAAQGRLDWRGFYAGVHGGGAIGLVDVDDPFGPSIFGDTVRTPGLLAGVQAGYNWQHGATVLGVEADADWADMDGTNTCFAYSGFFLSSNCRTHIDALGTVTGRLGWALPTGTLLYGKAGLAWEQSTVDAIVNGDFGFPRTSASAFRLGWTLGAGVERALSARWSLKAEYDFLAFNGENLAVPASGFQAVPDAIGTLLNTPGATTGLSQDIHQFKLGVNYRIGAGETDWGAIDAWGGPTPPMSGNELAAGVRYVHGWGKFHKDLGATDLNSLASRLSYTGMSTDGAELYGRLDSSFNVMVKGVVGAGSSGGGGTLNDEDWGLPFAVFVPYSNTISEVDSRVRYALIDLGYDWWRGERYKVAPFIGYSLFKQNMDDDGCRQIANPNSDCVPPIPVGVEALTEADKWQALRLGLAVDLPLAPRLTLVAESAYLPYVSFTGTDNHVLRSLLSPEDGRGIGVQLEAMLTYAVTDALRIGIGGRYWSMWTTSGTVNFGGTGAIVPMRYAAEQAHVLLEGTYTFNAAPSP